MDAEFLNSLCEALGLGAPTSPPRRLTGGLMHRMYRLDTPSGSYAAKLLNPHVMTRPTAMANYREAERLEEKLESAGLPILPALVFGGRRMQQLDGRYFYLYRFYDGQALRGEEITADHCRSIGRAMAAIHAVDRRDAGCGLEPINVDWRQYAGKLDGELDALLRKDIPLLCRMQEQGNSAISRIPPVQTICHNDLDPKNVMWRGEGFRIIDLECLGYASPYLELYEQALCWSGYEQLDIDFTKFSALVGAYLDSGGQLPEDREALYYANFSRLEWLKYNIERTLGVGCEPEEIPLGASQAASTLKLFEYYHRAKDSILDCLNSL